MEVDLAQLGEFDNDSVHFHSAGHFDIKINVRKKFSLQDEFIEDDPALSEPRARLRQGDFTEAVHILQNMLRESPRYVLKKYF